jgi:hypothetical protein
LRPPLPPKLPQIRHLRLSPNTINLQALRARQAKNFIGLKNYDSCVAENFAMRQLALFAIIYFFVSSCTAHSWEDNSGLMPLSQFEDGKLYKIDKLLIVQLSGSYLDMGRQEGYLLRNMIQEYYNESVENYFIHKKNLSYERMASESMKVYNLYPKRFRDIILGISETSGLPLEKIAILSRVPYIAPNCSAVFAWGNYSKDGSTIAGRNLDFYSDTDDFMNYTIVCVYNPTDGSHSVATVCSAAELEIHTGMNDQGLFLEANDGSSSGGGLYFPDRLTYIGSFLFDCSNLKQLDAAVFSSKINWATILNAADENEARSYEWATFDLKRAAPERNGFTASTNHFVNPEWELALPQGDPNHTFLRRENLLILGEKYKGEFDANIMMKVLDTSIEDGGASGPFTRLQVVAVPSEKEMWVKIPRYQNWTRVDLKSLFLTHSPGHKIKN